MGSHDMARDPEFVKEVAAQMERNAAEKARVAAEAAKDAAKLEKARRAERQKAADAKERLAMRKDLLESATKMMNLIGDRLDDMQSPTAVDAKLRIAKAIGRAASESSDQEERFGLGDYNIDYGDIDGGSDGKTEMERFAFAADWLKNDVMREIEQIGDEVLKDDWVWTDKEQRAERLAE